MHVTRFPDTVERCGGCVSGFRGIVGRAGPIVKGWGSGGRKRRSSPVDGLEPTRGPGESGTSPEAVERLAGT